MVLAVLGSRDACPGVLGAPENAHHNFNHLPSRMGSRHVGHVSMQGALIPHYSLAQGITSPKIPPKPPKNLNPPMNLNVSEQSPMFAVVLSTFGHFWR